MLERATGRGVTRPIARTADTIRRDRDELRQRTSSSTWSSSTSPMGRFGSTPPAWPPVRAGGGPSDPFAAYQVLSIDAPAPWTKAGIEAVLDLARGRPGRRRDLPDGRVARRDRRHVVVASVAYGVDRD
jgi:hypothetical protein